jgi:FMN phosphatase YigB (HAD superfamily)
MKYLAIDIGNVIVDMNFDSFLRELSMTLNISKDEAWNFLGRTQQLHDLGYTLIRDELRDHFKIRSEATIEKIMTEWNNTLSPNKGVISWLERLMDKGVNVALLSNMGFEHMKIMPDILGKKLYDNSVRYFSCEVGARKPSLIFYHTFLSLHPNFSGAVYLDDNEQNIETGGKFNLQPVLFDLFKMSSAENITAKIKEVELEILKRKTK